MNSAVAAVPAGYQSLRAIEKQSILWDNIAAQPYSELPGLDEGSSPSLREIFFSGIAQSFTSPTDEMVSGRKKIIHKWGTSVKVRFEADPTHPYSGIFQSGAVGIARMSLALPYKSGSDFVPGLAVKFFVDGEPSKNVTVMQRLEGQGSNTNYFHGTFTNILPDPSSTATKVGTWAFEVFVEDAIRLLVDHVASVSSGGIKPQQARAPYQLLFAPAIGRSTDENSADFRLELAKIPAGSVLYEIYARDSQAERSEVFKLGQLITESEFVASQYQDEVLYFQHSGTELKTGFFSRWFHLPYF